MPTNGLVVMTPTSIAYSGNSASINADGSVDFSTVSSLSLNGVFTSSYDNYMVTIRSIGNSALVQFQGRLRASGTDNTTASSYTFQLLAADGTSVSGSRGSNDFMNGFVMSSNTQSSGETHFFYGPYLAQPTAIRQVTGNGYLSGLVYDHAWTHNQSVSYDGFTLYHASLTLTGLLTVFGFNQ